MIKRDASKEVKKAFQVYKGDGATGGPEDSQLQTTINGYGYQQQATVLEPELMAPDITPNKTSYIKPPENPDQQIDEGRNSKISDHYTEPFRVIPNDRSERTRVREENNQEVVDITSTSIQTTNENLTEDRSSSPLSYEVQKNEQEESTLVMEPLGVTETRPKYQQFAILATRLGTFRNWPSHLNQRPEQLAKCGLFYEGNHDYVRCFHCAGGLREWEPEDDPFIEHARWFPFCTFMRQLKGDRFIMDVQSGKITSPLLNVPAVTAIPEDGFENCMDHPAVLSVMAMGYSEGWMKKAISVLRKHKEKPLTAENLLQIVWDLEESGEIRDENDEECKNETAKTPNPTGRHNSTTDAIKSEAVQAHSTSYHNSKTDFIKSGPAEEHSSSKDLETLANENRELREQKTCKVCLDEEASIVFLPCGHLVTCPLCSSALAKCPVCRTFIRGTVKAIIS
ncbi:baculoviral IAP repeat-containing protein 7-like [Pecten maximus]|uniref:baculoviral IAP repeat-containing protein 7-like n=1 Tax=Pecten maximus TaxID=6579 RepID=UPI00145916F0|nr:baculoviral IAP repeat-containing protein 7-like [Pecten maximus]